MISNKIFYHLLNEGLFNKYCRNAGPVQTINILYEKHRDIHILQKRISFDNIEVDFVGDFIEEKVIYADLTNPVCIKRSLNNIEGTLFIRDNMFEDLILEL